MEEWQVYASAKLVRALGYVFDSRNRIELAMAFVMVTVVTNFILDEVSDRCVVGFVCVLSLWYFCVM